MKNAKINKDRPNPPSKEIDATKNFDFVLRNSTGQKYKLIKIVGLIGIAVLTFIASKKYFAPKNAKSNILKSEIIKNKINKPIKNSTVPYEKILHDSKRKQNFVTKDQSIINIPKDACLTQTGELYEGKVIFNFRSFKSVPEIFISGIPMVYDSADIEYHLESAGMFELRALDTLGNVLKANPENLIAVEMSSNDASGKFNQYYLENDSVWDYLGKRTPVGYSPVESKEVTKTEHRISNRDRILQAKKKKDSIIKANLPRIPKTANKDRYALNLDYDKDKFPELALFENILFEVLPKNPEFDLEEIKENWNDIELIKKDENYYLTLFKNGIKRTINVQPVVAEGEDEILVKEVYDRLLLKLETEKSLQLKTVEAELDSLKKDRKKLTDSVRSVNWVEQSIAYQMSEESKSQTRVYRLFEVKGFGIYNSDCPSNLPKGFDFLEPVFVDKKNVKDTLKFSTMFLAEYGSNTLYRLYAGFDEQLSFNPKKETVLWGITKKNKLAVVYLNKIKGKRSKIDFKMELSNIPTETNAKFIRKALKWK